MAPRVALIGSEFEENLSLRYLAASAAQEGFESVLIPFNDDARADQVARDVLAFDPLVVGISIPFQLRARESLALADRHPRCREPSAHHARRPLRDVRVREHSPPLPGGRLHRQARGRSDPSRAVPASRRRRSARSARGSGRPYADWARRWRQAQASSARRAAVPGSPRRAARGHGSRRRSHRREPRLLRRLLVLLHLRMGGQRRRRAIPSPICRAHRRGDAERVRRAWRPALHLPRRQLLRPVARAEPEALFAAQGAARRRRR